MTLPGGLSTVDISLQDVCHICLCFSDELQVKLINTAWWTFRRGNTTGQSFDIIAVHKFLEAMFIKTSTKVKRKGKGICGQ